MINMRDIRKNPYSIIGGTAAVFTFSLIVLLFLLNSFIGNIGPAGEYLLYYIIPALLFISIILLTIERIKKASGKRRHKKVHRVRKEHSA